MAALPAESRLAMVRRFMNATGLENRAERAGLLHEDFVVHQADGVPFSGEYRGAQGLFDLMTKMRNVLEFTPGPIVLQALGEDAVAARFRLTFTSRWSGRSVEMSLVEIYTMRDGLIIDLDVYYKDPLAVALLLAQ
jgi:uncharacterized protein